MDGVLEVEATIYKAHLILVQTDHEANFLQPYLSYKLSHRIKYSLRSTTFMLKKLCHEYKNEIQGKRIY
jgi:hypothetical protein